MITITFNPTTPEQMAVLTAAMTTYIQAGPAPEPEAEAQPEPTKVRRVNLKKPPAEKPAAEEAPAITLEQLRAKMATVSQAGKGAECKALLATFGASNLTSVPAEKYSDLLAAVEAL